MTRTADHNVISPDGLRFTAREGGSPYNGGISQGNTKWQRSCFLCGAHKPTEQGSYRSMAGKQTFVCFGCRPPKAAALVSAG